MTTPTMTPHQKWEVVSPPIYYPGSDYGPPEEVPDYVVVEAGSRREAIIEGVRQMQHWPDEARGDGKPPWAGVKAFNLTCPHGVCWCNTCAPDQDIDRCPGCVQEIAEAELEREDPE